MVYGLTHKLKLSAREGSPVSAQASIFYEVTKETCNEMGCLVLVMVICLLPIQMYWWNSHTISQVMFKSESGSEGAGWGGCQSFPNVDPKTEGFRLGNYVSPYQILTRTKKMPF